MSEILPALLKRARRREATACGRVAQFDWWRRFRLENGPVGAHILGMAKNSRLRLLEVRVIPLKSNQWEWRVCDGDTPIMTGYESSRETAQIEGDSALFLLLRSKI
jgi:hypothetical protein